MTRLYEHKMKHEITCFCHPMVDSPSEEYRKSGPQGNGEWAGFDAVWNKLQYAAHKMASGKHSYLSDFHIETMGDMGSGHEERMKYRLHLCLTYGWLEGYHG